LNTPENRMMKKPSPLAGKLVEYIETRIVSGEYRVGSRIPSVRRFGAKFGMSYGTVYRSIEHLCEVGVLERKGSDGIFVKSRRVLGNGGGGGRIAVIMAPYVMEKESGLCHTAFMGIQDMALKYGYGLQISYIPTSNVNEHVVREAVREADGVILLNEYDHAMPDFPRLAIPAIGMLMQNSCNGRLALVNIDPIDMAKTAVNFFMERRSYLRKMYIYGSNKPVYAVRARLFKTFWEWGGGRVDIFTEPPNEYTAYEEDCGYFFTSDQWAQIACETYMARTGELLTDRHLILGVDGKQLLDPDFFRFPTIATDWRRIGEVLIEEMARMLREPNAFTRNINICGKLTIPAEAGDSLGC
jgi:DNA-binding LacI/PurR family transcriptional regulator